MHYDAEALAQKFNAQLREAKKEFELKEFENQSNDGLISVIVTGQREVKALSIDPSLAVDKKELLESMHADIGFECGIKHGQRS